MYSGRHCLEDETLSRARSERSSERLDCQFIILYRSIELHRTDEDETSLYRRVSSGGVSEKKINDR